MVLLAIIIALNIISIGFALVSIWRLYIVYVKKFPLPESKYTLLFKRISIQQLMFIYILSVLLIAAASLILTYLTM